MTAGSRFAWATSSEVVVTFWFKNAFKSGRAIAPTARRQIKPTATIALLKNNTILLQMNLGTSIPTVRMTTERQEAFQNYSINGSWAISLARRALSISSSASLAAACSASFFERPEPSPITSSSNRTWTLNRFSCATPTSRTIR